MGKTFAFQQGIRKVKAPVTEFESLFGLPPVLNTRQEEHGSDSDEQTLAEYRANHPLVIERDVSVEISPGNHVVTTGSVMKVSQLIPGFSLPRSTVVGYRVSPLGKKVFGPRVKGPGGFHSHPQRLRLSLGKKRRFRGPYREYAFDREFECL